MTGGMLVASLCGGMIANLLVTHVGAQGTSIVTTTQLNLVDRDGALRGVLSALNGNGMTSLSLSDSDGIERAVFGLERDGSPMFRLNDSGGQDYLGARLSGQDSYFVIGNDRERHALFSSLAGTPLLSLADGGNRRVQLHLGIDGEPSLVFFDREGQRSVAITVDPSDTPLVTLYENGRSRLTFGVVQQAVVANFSDASQPRLVLGVAENGRPSINFINENGETEHELP